MKIVSIPNAFTKRTHHTIHFIFSYIYILNHSLFISHHLLFITIRTKKSLKNKICSLFNATFHFSYQSLFSFLIFLKGEQYRGGFSCCLTNTTLIPIECVLLPTFKHRLKCLVVEVLILINMAPNWTNMLYAQNRIFSRSHSLKTENNNNNNNTKKQLRSNL
jgi:hypothetical protein